MSRHRHFRNLNITDELDDDALSDGGEEDVTPEQQALLHDGLHQVRAIIGEDDYGLSDNDIKNVLWDNYFDVEKTVQWSFDELERRNLAKERKDLNSGKSLPPLPPDDESVLGSDEPSSSFSPHQRMVRDQAETERPTGVPLIVWAQQQQQRGNDDGGHERMNNDDPCRLTTITEITERTEPSPYWPTKRLSLNVPRLPSSSPATSYGQMISSVFDPVDAPLDPNLIPVSPSGSALQRLSTYEPAPSIVSSDSRSSLLSPLNPPSEVAPPIEVLPEIPDYNSKSSRQPIPRPSNKSKLSMLASSRTRTSITRSESTISSDTGLSSSAMTYSALRPSSESARSLTASKSSSNSIAPSSTSSHVRRAIQTALDLEAVDRETTSRSSQPQSHPSAPSDRSKTPTLMRPAAPTPSKTAEMPSSSESQPAPRQPSKLALLAQTKAEAYKGPWMPKPRSSKVALPRSEPTLLGEHTEYLTPIANGPSVTTAITTSYQTVHSLTDPSRPPMIPAQYVVPLPSAGDIEHAWSPTEPKRSKLAMKIKMAHEKHQPKLPMAAHVSSPSVPPLFIPKPTRTRASPSAFASLLFDKPLMYSQVKDKDRDAHRKSKGKGKEKMSNTSGDLHSPISDNSEGVPIREPPKHLRSNPESAPSRIFAFDIPSPDDIVFNARRGTALARPRNVPSSSSSRSPALAGKSSPRT